MTKTEWEFWNNAPIPKGQELNFPVACKTLPVIKKRVTRIDYGQEILPGITALAAFGHTPGHLGLIIASGNETLLHTCEAAAHIVLSLAHPDWYFTGDSELQTVMKTRRKLFDQAAADKSLTFASHFPFPSLGHVKRSGLTSWEWQPIVYAWQ